MAVPVSGLSTPRPGRVRRVLAVLLAAACAAAFLTWGPRPSRAAAATGVPGGLSASWSTPAAIPGASNDSGPAMASYDGLLYAAWTSQGPPYLIQYSAYNAATGTWSPVATEPNAVTNNVSGPTLAVYHGDLYAFWTGKNQVGPQAGYRIWYASFNGTSWSSQAVVPSAVAWGGAAMSATAYDGDLYLDWVGASAKNIWYTSFTGTFWDAQTIMPDTSGLTLAGGTAAGSPLAVYGGLLYASWLGSTPNEEVAPVEYATFSGTYWSGPFSVGVKAAGGPAFAVLGGELYESWLAANPFCCHGPVKWASFNGTKWTGASTIPDAAAYTAMSPGLASYDGALYAAWEVSPTEIDYSARS